MDFNITRWLILPTLVLASRTCPGSDYLNEIKPLLEHKCYACHGALKQQGDLRVDTAAALIAGGESGLAVTAGKPGESLLIDVLSGEAGYRMPPENEGSPLSAKEIDLIAKWITEGATAPADEAPQSDPRSWWSYRPIERPPRPEHRDPSWCRTELDHFVAADRQRHRLPHTTEASKEVWLRRVFLDLIGLPPTRAEQRRFLGDESPLAYESVVDDLLSRPQYGERWGRHWMDVWRYSDWYGSRANNEIRYSQRHIWRWRDWIVASLNEDHGYDQMVREMLAADEISDGDQEVLPATGYLGRNWYKFDRDVWMFDTVERTGQAFLGLTLRCCRCHDHKFDPITQEEYYRFRAFFEPHDVRTDPLSALTSSLKDATLGQVLSDGIPLVYDKTPDKPTYLFERGDSRSPDKSKPLPPGVPAALGGTVEIKPIDLATQIWYPAMRSSVRETLVVKGEREVAKALKQLQETQSAAEVAQWRVSESAGGSATVELETLLHDDFSTANPDRWNTINGTWDHKNGKLLQSAVTSFATIVTTANIGGDFHVHLRYRTLRPGSYRSVGFSFDYQDNGNSQDIYTSTGNDQQSVQAFHRISGKQIYPKEGIVATKLQVGEETVLDVAVSGSNLTINLNGECKLDYVMPEKRRDGKFALWVHQGAAEFLDLKITRQAASRETLERQKRDAMHAVDVARAQWNLERGKVASVQKRLAAEVEAYIDKQQDSASPTARQARVAELSLEVLRAKVEVAKTIDSPDKHAESRAKLAAAIRAAENPIGPYAAVGKQFAKTSTGRRAALAKWITSTANPRTARVAVNHIWARHFGQPLVASPDNFGLNGRQPTHPKLLDFLASEMMANQWRMKPLHKQLVLSATYRMTSTPEFSDAGETDSTIAMTTAQQGDPDNLRLWRMNSRRMEAEVVRDSTLYLASQLDLAMGGPEIPETDGQETPRRSLYFRTTPNEKMEMLDVFDAADPNACYRRKESIVPHQSLAMMNSGLTQDAARLVAEKLSNETDFVSAAFQTVLAREPTAEEAFRSREFLVDHAKLVEAKLGRRFSPGGTATRAPAKDPAQRAKENLVHVLFLHNDFVTVR